VTQLPLLTRTGKPARKRTPRDEQARQIGRVRERIAPAVLGYLRTLEPGATFTTVSLTKWVWGQGVECASDSPRRIMSLLDGEGLCAVECVQRSKGLWRMRWVKEATNG
jgi:hypothetical protein